MSDDERATRDHRPELALAAAVLTVALCLGVTTAALAQASLESFYPIVGRRPVIEHEVELRAAHERRHDGTDTTVTIAVEAPILPRWGVSLALPIAISDPRDAASTAGVGDLTIESKVVLFMADDRRSLVTAGLTVTAPTGSERRHLGGSAVIEPFAAFGLALGDLLVVADVGYAATVAGQDRDGRRVAGTLAVGRAFGSAVIPFVALTGAWRRSPERDADRAERFESYAATGLNLRVLSRATLGLGVQLPLTRARGFDHAFFTTLDWDL